MLLLYYSFLLLFLFKLSKLDSDAILLSTSFLVSYYFCPLVTRTKNIFHIPKVFASILNNML